MAYVMRFASGGLPPAPDSGVVPQRYRAAVKVEPVKRWIAAGRYFTEPDIAIPGEAQNEAHRRRYARRKAQTTGPRYVLADVAKRDGFRCHICGARVDMGLSGRHPMGPTADHLLPVAAGGGDESTNIALAHLRCNIKRGTKGVAQLRLVG